MFFSFSILLLCTNFIKSPTTYSEIPLRTDCYASFSNPIIYLPVSHYNPSGPLYLHVKFNYTRHSLLPDIGIENASVEFDFKRIDITCESSVTFTTFGDDFKKLDIIIIIYLVKNHNFVAVFEYNFYKGCKPNFYGLKDLFENFKIHIQISNDIKNHLNNSVNLNYTIESYSESNTTQNGEICIITPNNPVVILKPRQGLLFPSGLIVGLEFNIFKDGIFFDKYYVPAFVCNKDKKYPDIPVIFIIDRKKIDVKFKIVYIKYFTNIPLFKRKTFEISSSKYEFADNLQKISQEYHKVFLVKDTSKYRKCSDGSLFKLFRSESGKIYLTSKITEGITIWPKIKSVRQYFRLLLYPCQK